jgi:hypothetical protein
LLGAEARQRWGGLADLTHQEEYQGGIHSAGDEAPAVAKDQSPVGRCSGAIVLAVLALEACFAPQPGPDLSMAKTLVAQTQKDGRVELLEGDARLDLVAARS